jgi:hypothetical protein
MCMCVYVCVFVCVCMCVYMYVCMYVCICMYVRMDWWMDGWDPLNRIRQTRLERLVRDNHYNFVFIQTYIHIFTHTHTHTNIMYIYIHIYGRYLYLVVLYQNNHAWVQSTRLKCDQNHPRLKQGLSRQYILTGLSLSLDHDWSIARSYFSVQYLTPYLLFTSGVFASEETTVKYSKQNWKTLARRGDTNNKQDAARVEFLTKLGRFVDRNINLSCRQAVQLFFSLSWHFYQKYY